jgi:septal ring factor EnvC (AmiA/AmiB activator)
VIAAATTSPNWIVGIVAALLGSGVFGGIYLAVRRLGAGTFTVIASKDLVEAARDIAGDLRRDLNQARDEIAELKQQTELVAELQRQVNQLKSELAMAKTRERLLLEERASLHQRVKDLEADVARLKNGDSSPERRTPA